MLERTMLLDGFSKTYAMTGWRCGFAAVPEPLVDPLVRFFVNSTSCVPPFVQLAGVAALTGRRTTVAGDGRGVPRPPRPRRRRPERAARLSCRASARRVLRLPERRAAPASAPTSSPSACSTRRASPCSPAPRSARWAATTCGSRTRTRGTTWRRALERMRRVPGFAELTSSRARLREQRHVRPVVNSRCPAIWLRCVVDARTGTQAIDRAAQLLCSVVESGESAFVGELATRAGLPKSTTSRLLAALERQGLVQRLGERGASTRALSCFASPTGEASSALVELACASLRPPRASPPERPSTSASRRRSASSSSTRRDTSPLRRLANWVGRRGAAPRARPTARCSSPTARRACTSRSSACAAHDRRPDEARARAGARRAAATRRASTSSSPGSRRSRARLRSRRRRVAALAISGPTARLTTGASRARASARRRGEQARGTTRAIAHEARCRMTNEEILQGLFDNTLVGNAPAVKRARRARASSRDRGRRRCSTTR